MVDIDLPIIPGRGAAGIEIGTPNSKVLMAAPGVFRPEPVVGSLFGETGTTVDRSNRVDVWETNRIISQIVVHGNYRGKHLGKAGVGSTIAENEVSIGPCVEDIYDNLVEEPK